MDATQHIAEMHEIPRGLVRVGAEPALARAILHLFGEGADKPPPKFHVGRRVKVKSDGQAGTVRQRGPKRRFWRNLVERDCDGASCWCADLQLEPLPDEPESKFAKGDWVECVDASNCDLTVGKRYHVTGIDMHWPCAASDTGPIYSYPPNRFIPAPGPFDVGDWVERTKDGRRYRVFEAPETAEGDNRVIQLAGGCRVWINHSTHKHAYRAVPGPFDVGDCVRLIKKQDGCLMSVWIGELLIVSKVDAGGAWARGAAAAGYGTFACFDLVARAKKDS